MSTVSTACQTEEVGSKDEADGSAGRKRQRKKKPSAFWFWALAALSLGIYLSKVGAVPYVLDHRLVTCVRKAERQFSATESLYCAGSKTSATKLYAPSPLFRLQPRLQQPLGFSRRLLQVGGQLRWCWAS